MRFFAFGLFVLSAAVLSEAFSIASKFYDAKDDLKKILDTLKAAAEAEIKKLEAEGKQALGVELQSIEKDIESLESQLEKLDVSSAEGKLLLAGLEVLAKKAEEALKAEINKLSGGFYDAKSDLKKILDTLIAEADAEIKKLEAEGKQALGVELQTIEKDVEDLEAKLEKLDTSSVEGKLALAGLEALAKEAEKKLKAEIKKLEGSFYDASEDLLNTLLILAEKLKNEVENEITKLRNEGKSELAKGLEIIEATVLDVEGQLQKLDPTSLVGKALLGLLETALKKAETALEAELKNLTGSFYDAKSDLKKILDTLKADAEAEIKKLEAEGKQALGVELQTIEKDIESLEGQLEKLDVSSAEGKLLLAGLEALAKKAEEALLAEIKKLEGSFYDAKSDLKKILDTLKAEADAEIKKLEAEGKQALGVELQTIEKDVEDLEAKLEKLDTSSVEGKLALAGLEALAKEAEKKLLAEIKKLEGSF